MTMKAERQQKVLQTGLIQSKQDGFKLGIIDNRSQTISQTKLIKSIQNKENKKGSLCDFNTNVENTAQLRKITVSPFLNQIVKGNKNVIQRNITHLKGFLKSTFTGDLISDISANMIREALRKDGILNQVSFKNSDGEIVIREVNIIDDFIKYWNMGQENENKIVSEWWAYKKTKEVQKTKSNRREYHTENRFVADFFNPSDNRHNWGELANGNAVDESVCFLGRDSDATLVNGINRFVEEKEKEGAPMLPNFFTLDLVRKGKSYSPEANLKFIREQSEKDNVEFGVFNDEVSELLKGENRKMNQDCKYVGILAEIGVVEDNVKEKSYEINNLKKEKYNNIDIEEKICLKLETIEGQKKEFMKICNEQDELVKELNKKSEQAALCEQEIKKLKKNKQKKEAREKEVELGALEADILRIRGEIDSLVEKYNQKLKEFEIKSKDDFDKKIKNLNDFKGKIVGRIQEKKENIARLNSSLGQYISQIKAPKKEDFGVEFDIELNLIVKVIKSSIEAMADFSKSDHYQCEIEDIPQVRKSSMVRKLSQKVQGNKVDTSREVRYLLAKGYELDLTRNTLVKKAQDPSGVETAGSLPSPSSGVTGTLDSIPNKSDGSSTADSTPVPSNEHNCLINAICLSAYGRISSQDENAAVRRGLKQMEGMLLAEPKTIDEIRKVLNIKQKITVNYPDRQAEVFVGVAPEIVIYHNGVDHFSSHL